MTDDRGRRGIPVIGVIGGAAILLVLTAAGPRMEGSTAAGAVSGDTAMITRTAAEITWSDLELAGFAPGLRIAALAGDPSAEGGTYTLRLMFPDGYEFPRHWHPNAENLTVVSGSFRLAMRGADRSMLRTYAPGDYLYIPGGMSHWGNVSGETVIQLHGLGPFAVNLGTGPSD